MSARELIESGKQEKQDTFEYYFYVLRKFTILKHLSLSLTNANFREPSFVTFSLTFARLLA